MNVVTVEEFRSKALKAVDIYLKKPEDERKPCMFVLDSLGMLSTEKEITDALNDKQVRDMTKSQLIKGAFRMLTLKLGQDNIPMIVTNHTYDVIGSYVPTKEMGGGSGLKYAASTIIHLSKKKEKDGTEVVGNLIKAKTAKSRLSKENKDVTVRLYYDERGLDRYYGLLELGELGGLWKNVAGRYEIDGKKVYAKAIYKDPEAYFTPEVMEKLDVIAKGEFNYGGSKLNDLIKIYSDSLTVETCEDLIEIYETNKEHHERIDNDRRPNFTQLNFTDIHNDNKEYSSIHRSLVSIVKKHKNEYYKFIDSRCFPDSHNMEFFRIKKYECNGKDEFDTHVDVMDHGSSRRYLAFLWYLNGVKEGGETNFEGLTIPPKPGKLLVFPPMWMFPHNGKPPISG